MNTTCWYAVRVRSRFEQVTLAHLQAKNYDVFLPMLRNLRRWSDRVKETATPLFPGYVFCRFNLAKRLPILQSPGVVHIVGLGSQPVPVPDDEIAAIKVMVSSSLPVLPHPFLATGQRIRIDRGPLEGAEGIVVEIKKQFRLIASISVFQRSVFVELERDWIHPLPSSSSSGPCIGPTEQLAS